tara:strand:- start:1968 stop:2957 length:990 start_codon:yes stop_codon:yes gene_type:complete
MAFKKNEIRVGTKRLSFKKVIITGVCRSGKTLLGRILGTLKNVEYMDEPWLATILPHFLGNKLIDPQVAKDFMASYVEELFNDVILLRQTNFRPNDQSSIWDRKGIKELYERLINLHTRDDVRDYVRSKKPTLILNLSLTNPFLFFLKESLPGCKIIHVIRNGLDVALEVEKKKWYSNERLRKPICNGLLYRIHKSNKFLGKYYIPWWVEKNDEEKFLKMNDFTKGLYFWRRYFELSENQIKDFKSAFPNQYKEVRFEKILRNPMAVLDDLSGFFNTSITEQTNLVLSNINTEQLKTQRKYPLNRVPRDEKNKVKKLLTNLKYPCNNLF